jgi:hypothetical protein
VEVALNYTKIDSILNPVTVHAQNILFSNFHASFFDRLCSLNNFSSAWRLLQDISNSKLDV